MSLKLLRHVMEVEEDTGDAYSLMKGTSVFSRMEFIYISTSHLSVLLKNK